MLKFSICIRKILNLHSENSQSAFGKFSICPQKYKFYLTHANKFSKITQKQKKQTMVDVEFKIATENETSF